jgi:transposase-like protein
MSDLEQYKVVIIGAGWAGTSVSYWLKLKTNNPMERLLKEARRRTKMVGAFPDGHSALMLVSARLRHASATNWGLRKYMNMKLLEMMDNQAVSAA